MKYPAVAHHFTLDVGDVQAQKDHQSKAPPKRAGTCAAWVNGVAPELAAKNKEYMFQVAMGKTNYLVNEN